MSVSAELERSAKDFSLKYTCKFDFATFESKVEEFTFLRPNGGWIDVYKMTFGRMYKQALEGAVKSSDTDLNSEEMLDDFEYTLIRPYVNEGEREIKHKPYVGMDRLSRLEFLDQLTRQAPSNFVELYAEKYKSGALSIRQMRSALTAGEVEQARRVEMVGYVHALEAVNQGRSPLWRALHPFKNNAEKRYATLMKEAFVGKAFYREATVAAHQTFDGHQRVSANLAQSMLRAKEEVSRKQKMNDVMRESICIKDLDKEPVRELSQRVDRYHTTSREKQI